MMTSEEAPGLLDRFRVGGRMTTARASDDGDHSCFLFFLAWQEKENQNISELKSRRTRLSRFSAEKVATRGTGEGAAK